MPPPSRCGGFVRGLGSAALGIGSSLLGMALFARIGLAPKWQDGGLVAQGLVLGGAAAVFGAPALGASLLAAPWTIAAFRHAVFREDRALAAQGIPDPPDAPSRPALPRVAPLDIQVR